MCHITQSFEREWGSDVLLFHRLNVLLNEDGTVRDVDFF